MQLDMLNHNYRTVWTVLVGQLKISNQSPSRFFYNRQISAGLGFGWILHQTSLRPALILTPRIWHNYEKFRYYHHLLAVTVNLPPDRKTQRTSVHFFFEFPVLSNSKSNSCFPSAAIFLECAQLDNFSLCEDNFPVQYLSISSLLCQASHRIQTQIRPK